MSFYRLFGRIRGLGIGKDTAGIKLSLLFAIRLMFPETVPRPPFAADEVVIVIIKLPSP